MALTETAHQLIREHFAGANLSNTVAVDATCGNGHDTVFLAELGFPTVLSFDIQSRALEITQQTLNEPYQNNVKLIQDGHENLAKHIESTVDCVMFNLGYMPNADKTITTTETTTIKALETGLEKLTETGLVSIICYPGHPAGKQEADAVQCWFTKLNDKWAVMKILAERPGQKAPILYQIKRSNFARETINN